MEHLLEFGHKLVHISFRKLDREFNAAFLKRIHKDVRDKIRLRATSRRLYNHVETACHSPLQVEVDTLCQNMEKQSTQDLRSSTAS